MRYSLNLHEHEPNLGREDRLVRGGLALSLFLLTVVSLFGGIGLIQLLFLVLFGYSAVTTARNWDPVYERLHINTIPAASQAPAELGLVAGTSRSPRATLTR